VGVLTEVEIRAARAADADRLREIARVAKAHWGYNAPRVRAWAAALPLPPESDRWVAEADGELVAWAELAPPLAGVCTLDDMWVEPAWMGRGIGTRLFAVAVGRARELGAERVEWGTEPNAVGFYERLGARRLGEHPGAWGRVVPVMGLDL
jgi:GNAT superfamily N-acetyltransferase